MDRLNLEGITLKELTNLESLLEKKKIQLSKVEVQAIVDSFFKKHPELQEIRTEFTNEYNDNGGYDSCLSVNIETSDEDENGYNDDLAYEIQNELSDFPESAIKETYTRPS